MANYLELAQQALQEFRREKDDVVLVFRQWLAEHCVGARGVCSNPAILHREYCAQAQGAVLTYEPFIEELEAKGWRLDTRGMVVGLCLSEDFLAARELSQAVLVRYRIAR